MANRTVKDAHSIKGTNPQYLIEKIIRTRIYECRYWKEDCFALSAELLVDKAMGLKYVGGVYGGNVKPAPFLCLLLKMLQIQPEKDIIVEFIRNEDFKYVRALGSLYMRLTGTSIDCYKYLEPLYLDYRKLKRQQRDGTFELVHMDEYIDELLREERSCDIILPRIQKRNVLEEGNLLDSRVSALDEDLEDMETSDEEDIMDIYKEAEKKRSSYRGNDKPARSPSPKSGRGSSPHHRDRTRKRSRSKDRSDKDRKSDKRYKDDDRKHRSHKSSKDHRDKDRGDDRHKDRHRDRHRDHGSRDSRHTSSKEDLEIQEANELRAKLGMAPLRP
ncbi:pre-mRNA-splicing factor 38A-like [Ruditapes philippinarum]|uniref:pre-mRNA-splicing factor 38A-like n=1 Tax=Ruditapes philippinarum TaxID=129788 RepID=UPI00295A84E5|nr:pre-mRNA-splicing factor 38A-like [Ruditapes philippinarum]